MVAALMEVAVSLGLGVHSVRLGLGEGGQLRMEAVQLQEEAAGGGGLDKGGGVPGNLSPGRREVGKSEEALGDGAA